MSLIAGAVRVALRTFWSPVYILWLRVRVAVWGMSAFEHAVAHCPPWLGLEVLKAYGVSIGTGIDFHGRLFLHGTYDMRGKLKIGEYCHIGPGVTLDLSAPIVLEDRCTIAMNAHLITHIDVGYSPLGKHAYPSHFAPLTLEYGAYVGAGATVLMGVRVGRCAVVAAGALVREDVPAYAVVAGVPARTIRQLDPAEVELQ